MRKKLIAGNWKMNLSFEEATNLFHAFEKNAKDFKNCDFLIFAPYVYLKSGLDICDKKIQIGAQNFFPQDNGAFTGEISIKQLQELGIDNLLIGHSERRTIFYEGVDFIKEKVSAAVEKNIPFVFCCGEPLEIREEAKEKEFVEFQLNASLFHLDSKQIKLSTIAYEPVWAIGTGKTASPQQAEEMHLFIRDLIAERYNKDIAEEIRILYGGSCNPANAFEIFACPNVDGGLIGGASLIAEDFFLIAKSI